MAADTPTPDIYFAVLGPVSMRADGRSVDLGSPRQRALLALLLINAGSVVSVPGIISSIWGSSPPRMVIGTLQSYVSRLRKVLRSHVRNVRLVHRPHGYALEADPKVIDARIFESMARESRRRLESGDPAAAREAAWTALALWKGMPFAELSDYEFAVLEATRLDQVRVLTLQTWADACLRLGAYDEVALRLNDELNRDPSLERLGLQLMQAEYHSGRPAEALKTYERMRRHLAKELGADMSRELQDLHGEILRQDVMAHTDPHGGPAAPASEPGPIHAPSPDESLAAPAATRPRTAGHGRLIGRQAELDRLDLLVAGARAGEGRVMLVLGEQGVGKTELLRQMERDRSDSTARVVWSECVGRMRTPPYWPWQQIVRQLATAPPAPAPDGQELDQHFAFQEAVCDAVVRAAEREQLVIVLEDLHLADVRVLELLQLLTKRIRGSRVVVLATLRDYHLPSNPVLRGTVGRILQEVNADSLHLMRLTDSQIQDLVTLLLQDALSPDAVRLLGLASGGNPFLLISLLSSPDAARNGYRSVPIGLREVLHERLNECVPEAINVLSVCAVIGTSLSRALLSAVLDSRGLEQSLVALALRTGLLCVDRGDGEQGDGEQLSFANGLIREQLLDGIPPRTRAQLHRDIADALAEQLPESGEGLSIGEHCLGAARLLGADAGIEPLVKLSDEAERRLFYAEAVRWLRAAADLVTALPHSQHNLAVELRLRTRIMWLTSLIEGYGAVAVEHAFHRARELENALDNSRPTALLHSRAIMTLTAGHYSAAAGIAGLLHELAEHGGGARARGAACYVEGVVLHVTGQLSRSLEVLTSSLDLVDQLAAAHRADGGRVEQLHDQRIDYRAYLALGHWLDGEPAQAEGYRAELLRLTQSDHYDRPWDRAFARYVDSVLAAAGGDVRGARQAAAAGVDLATRCRLSYWHNMLSVPLGWAETHQGQHEVGLNRMAGAIQRADSARSRLRLPLHLGLFAEAQRYAGRFEAGRGTIARAAREIDAREEYVYYQSRWPFASMLTEHLERRAWNAPVRPSRGSGHGQRPVFVHAADAETAVLGPEREPDEGAQHVRHARDTEYTA